MLLEQQRQELFDYATSISLDDLFKKPTEDSWDTLQILAHLALIEQDATKAVQQALLDQDYVEEVPQKPVHLAADRTKKVETKDRWQPKEPHYTLETVMAQLEHSRQALNQVLSHASDRDLEHLLIETDPFGPISIAQFIDFLQYHEQRHFDQIKENVQLPS